MPFRVNVELKNGAVCRMGKKAFNAFLSLDEVTRFKRSDGWVNVKHARLRDFRKICDYRCPDRRNIF